MRYLIPIALALLPLAASSGCQKTQAATLERIPITGTVTLDGQPLADAEVTFTSGLMAKFTALTGPDGGYQLSALPRTAAEFSGVCRVTITKFEMPPGKTWEPNLSPQLQGARQVIAPRYSDPLQTTLLATVPGQGGRFDFPLSTQ